MRKCKACEIDRPDGWFRVNRGYREWKCRVCRQPGTNEAQIRHKRRLRQDVLAGYGGRCAWCGETDEEVLVLDHVNDNGAEHRRQLGGNHAYKVYLDARRRGYPPDYQLLCANDNQRKAIRLSRKGA